MNKILQPATFVLEVDNVIIFIFLFVVLCDIGGAWGSHRLTWKAFAIWFYSGDVNDGVNAHRVGKTELNSIGPNQLHDGIGTKPPFQQLPRSMRKVEVISGEPALITDGICQCVQARLICLHENVGMCFDQVVIGMREAISKLLGSGCFHNLVCKAHTRRVGVSELERGELHGRVLSVVDGELCQTEPVGPLSLFFHAEEMHILLYFLIHDFHLAVCLRVMSHGQFQSDAKLLADVICDL